MSNKKKVYITTTLPYVNAEPHIGFALEIVQADAFARFKTLLDFDVFFNFGTDEHGLKIYRKALENKTDPQTYVDEYAEKFDQLKKALNLSYNNFIRTTDPHHIKAAQEFWKRCLKNGDIYKKLYKIKYCVGCELEKTDSELDNGKCPIHPSQKIETIKEENYFFKFSKYQNKLLDLYKNNPEFVIPRFRLKEIEIFVKNGLQDFSVSRLKKKMPWGIDVPYDKNHVLFVWFDALINYISAIGWPDNLDSFNKWWPVIQFAGKDNLRQQSAIWQAMLMSAGLTPSKQIFIHGFITVNGQKISKSLGNVINPIAICKKYGTDALRYFLLAKIHPYEDSDFTEEKFIETYNADLANGLGNLISRVAKLCENSGYDYPQIEKHNFIPSGEIEKHIENFQFNEALALLWAEITTLDQHINKEEPWKLKGESLMKIVGWLVAEIRGMSYRLKPFLPKTAEIIEKQFKGPNIKSQLPLFPRIKSK